MSELEENSNGFCQIVRITIASVWFSFFRKHYVEYLVVLVNDNLLDPADIMSSADLTRVLQRGFVNPPAKPNRMNDDNYRQLLLTVSVTLLTVTCDHARFSFLCDNLLGNIKQLGANCNIREHIWAVPRLGLITGYLTCKDLSFTFVKWKPSFMNWTSGKQCCVPSLYPDPDLKCPPILLDNYIVMKNNIATSSHPYLDWRFSKPELLVG